LVVNIVGAKQYIIYTNGNILSKASVEPHHQILLEVRGGAAKTSSSTTTTSTATTSTKTNSKKKKSKKKKKKNTAKAKQAIDDAMKEKDSAEALGDAIR
jgi:hypothetical protein